MQGSQRRPGVEAFFLPVPDGARFCVHHPPRHKNGLGVVFASAFAEEMNKSRHIVAQASRRLAAQGFGVLCIDFKGCGDSSGSFDQASWADWRQDISTAIDWMLAQGYSRVVLWGHRLGAMLAAQAAAARPNDVARCLLWQPVVQGETHLVQFLRLRLANAMLSGHKGGETGKSLRARLSGGETLEVAGYPLSPGMADDLDRLELGTLRPACAVDWIEIVAEQGQALPVGAARVTEAWRKDGVALVVSAIVAQPFWAATNAVELVPCDAIVEATASAAKAWL